MVDGLDLAHFDEPVLDVLGGRHQHTVSVLSRLRQHSVQVVDSGDYSPDHLSPVRRRLRTGIECCAESAAKGMSISLLPDVRIPFTYLLHSRLELFALKEDNEHRLIHVVAGVRVFQRILDLGLS